MDDMDMQRRVVFAERGIDGQMVHIIDFSVSTVWLSVKSLPGTFKKISCSVKTYLILFYFSQMPNIASYDAVCMHIFSIQP